MVKLVEKLAREWIAAQPAGFEAEYSGTTPTPGSGYLAGFRAARELIQEHLEGLHPVSQQDVASLAAFGEQEVPEGTP